MTFTITLSDAAVQAALTRLQQAVAHPRPVLQAVGEDIMERAKERFSSSRGPDGQPWAANSAIYAAMQQFGGRRAQFPQLWGDIPARPFIAPASNDGR